MTTNVTTGVALRVGHEAEGLLVLNDLMGETLPKYQDEAQVASSDAYPYLSWVVQVVATAAIWDSRLDLLVGIERADCLFHHSGIAGKVKGSEEFWDHMMIVCK